MNKLLIIFLILILPANASKKLKAGVSYKFDLNQKIKLKVTELPHDYPWLERSESGEVKLPSIGSTIITTNTEAITIYDANNTPHVLPSGTRFYAKLIQSKQSRKFARNGGVELSFYKLEIPEGLEIIKGQSQKTLNELAGLNKNKPKGKNEILLDSEQMNFNSTKNNPVLSSSKAVINAAAHSAAGAIIAPLTILNSFKILGLAGLSNPYVLGGAAAIGGGVGFVYGIQRQGKNFILEPGTTIEVNLEEPWGLTEKLPTQIPQKQNLLHIKSFDLEILQTKKFGRELLIKLKYSNRSGEELRYLSFQLVDSMGKEYYPNSKSFNPNYSEPLPIEGELKLYFEPEFLNAEHQLKVLRTFNRKPMAISKIEIK